MNLLYQPDAQAILRRCQIPAIKYPREEAPLQRASESLDYFMVKGDPPAWSEKLSYQRMLLLPDSFTAIEAKDFFNCGSKTRALNRIKPLLEKKLVFATSHSKHDVVFSKTELGKLFVKRMVEYLELEAKQ